MQIVGVRGADGSVKNLAVVRREGGVAYVCPPGRYDEAMAGDDASVVGFPEEAISPPVRELQL